MSQSHTASLCHNTNQNVQVIPKYVRLWQIKVFYKLYFGIWEQSTTIGSHLSTNLWSQNVFLWFHFSLLWYINTPVTREGNKFTDFIITFSISKESACNAEDPGLIPGSGRIPREGNGYPLQYSYLENSMDRGARQALVHGVAKRWTQLSNFHFHL